MNIKFKELESTLIKILEINGCSKTDSELVSKTLTENSCDGVSSHGINRFTKIIEFIQKGYIKVDASPEVVSSFGALEVIDGHFGLGIKNAYFSIKRSISIAKNSGISCVALRNNNHWMRGATYGLQGAKSGLITICFTNTLPNMPAWGSTDQNIGNNPLVIAIPNGDKPVVLDMAMSQFSYGRVETATLKNSNLPMVGGYDQSGELTTNPTDIIKSGRILPAGFWKGSGLSMVLDLMATILSGGLSTREVGSMPVETGVSQVFICIDPSKLNNNSSIEDIVESMISYIKSSEKVDSNSEIRYPGEGSNRTRDRQLKEGIYVDDSIWASVLSLLK